MCRLFAFQKDLRDVRCVAEILRQTSHGHSVVRFVLNSVDAAQAARALKLASKTGNSVQTYGRLGSAFVSHGDFDAVGITGKCHREVRTLAGEVFE